MKSKIDKLHQKIYERRVFNILVEANIFDKRGNLVVKPGLKVTHKKSGYEYTVHKVIGSGEEIQISLLKPDEPRFDPPKKLKIKDAPRAMNGFIDSDDQLSKSIENPEDIESMLAPDPDDVFIIDKKEFEKDYEVK